MILAVRRGSALRRVARRFGVSHTTVRRWASRTGGQRLNRVDFADRRSGRSVAANRTARRMERMILTLRQQLAKNSALGECGATAIRNVLLKRRIPQTPCVRTIGRILLRHGMLDGRRRVRRPPPPKGWYLPKAAAGPGEIDSFDTITDLVIKGGLDVTVLNGISLHGGLTASWPAARITAKFVVQKLLEHWRRWGLPGHAKFDNDTIFQGTHRWPDSFGRVTRLCLQLGVTPVFVPPREPGFQAEVEAFNGRWQRSVWRRFVHRDLTMLQRRSRGYIAADRTRSAPRLTAGPARNTFPKNFVPDYQRPLTGVVIFIRRADAQGRVDCLGHRWLVDRQWPHRLIRIEVDLTARQARIYTLRRREPTIQPLIKTFRYVLTQHKFTE